MEIEQKKIKYFLTYFNTSFQKMIVKIVIKCSPHALYQQVFRNLDLHNSVEKKLLSYNFPIFA